MKVTEEKHEELMTRSNHIAFLPAGGQQRVTGTRRQQRRRLLARILSQATDELDQL